MQRCRVPICRSSSGAFRDTPRDTERPSSVAWPGSALTFWCSPRRDHSPGAPTTGATPFPPAAATRRWHSKTCPHSSGTPPSASPKTSTSHPTATSTTASTKPPAEGALATDSEWPGCPSAADPDVVSVRRCCRLHTRGGEAEPLRRQAYAAGLASPSTELGSASGVGRSSLRRGGSSNASVRLIWRRCVSGRSSASCRASVCS
jgi:hypothetical protein